MLPTKKSVTERREKIGALAVFRHVRGHQTEFQRGAFSHRRDREMQNRELKRMTHDEHLRCVRRVCEISLRDVIEKFSVARTPRVVVAVVWRTGSSRRKNQIVFVRRKLAEISRLHVLEHELDARIFSRTRLPNATAMRRKQRVAWFATPLFMSTRQTRTTGDGDGIAQ